MSDLVERLRGLHVTHHPSRSVVECDETTIIEAAARIEQLEAALRVSIEFMSIATDWNLDKVEINGQWHSTYDLIDQHRAALGEKPDGE